MAKVLILTFKNEAGQKVNLRVQNPKENLTAQEVEAVMDLILEKNIFPTLGGDLTEKVGAEVVETTATPVG